MPRLEGVFPVLPTPFKPGGEPDADALLRLADWAIACGVDGIVFPGMASEVETLKPEERAALVARLGRQECPSKGESVHSGEPAPGGDPFAEDPFTLGGVVDVLLVGELTVARVFEDGDATEPERFSTRGVG